MLNVLSLATKFNIPFPKEVSLISCETTVKENSKAVTI